MKQEIKAIIFDMDGLMFDTEKLWIEAGTTTAKKWGYEKEITLEVIKSCMGKKPEAIEAMIKAKLDEVCLKREGKEFDFTGYRKQYLAYMHNAIETRGMPIKEG
ncbi:MAG: HAD hydrolase-like protein, partial [Oscillospiraceae bacterium]|nr:HAD hydrolase-like protein [Oscillospiraceae bacterium]